MNKITILGISIIFLYSLTQILQFYGVSPETYLLYVYFVIFIIVSIFILPNDYPKM